MRRSNLPFARRDGPLAVFLSAGGFFFIRESRETKVETGMTPATIQARLLSARQTELRRIVEELQAWPPANIVELLAACRDEQDAISVESRRLQHDRAAVSMR